ncbi:MAG: hypothetical protein WEC84_01100, partial [Candidatus Andersenbacteria bacterium]
MNSIAKCEYSRDLITRQYAESRELVLGALERKELLTQEERIVMESAGRAAGLPSQAESEKEPHASYGGKTCLT